MAKLTYTGAQLDAAIRKVRSDFADVSGVDLLAAEARLGKKYIDASKQEVTGTMPDAVITPNVTVNGGKLTDTESDFPIIITPKATVGMAGYTDNIPDGAAVTKYINTEEKSVSPTTAEQEITPSASKLISKVTVAAIQTEEKTCTPSASAQEITPTYGKYLSKVTVAATPTEEKTVTANGEITPTYGKFISKVTVNVQPSLQQKAVTPTDDRQEITPDSGYDGQSKVIANAASGGEQLTLNAPSLSISGSTLTITNPTSNGGFVAGFKVFSNGTLLTSTSSSSLNLTSYITEIGNYAITAKCYGTNFNDSASSPSVTYINNTLTAPVISLSGSVLTVGEVAHATVYDIYSDGSLVASVSSGFAVTMTNSPADIDETGGTSTVILNEGLASEVSISPLSDHIGETWSGIKTMKTVFDNGYGQVGYLDYTMNGTSGTMYSGDIINLTGNLTIDSSINTQCLTGDTLILMSDGTEKRLDEVGKGDVVLSYNPETLKLVSDTVLYSDKGLKKNFTEYDVWYLSDGSVLKTVHAHRFYNIERQAFVYMSQWNIGEHFLKSDGTQPTLIGHETVKEFVYHYSLKTTYHNYFANGMLTGSRRTAPMKLGKTEGI